MQFGQHVKYRYRVNSSNNKTNVIWETVAVRLARKYCHNADIKYKEKRTDKNRKR